MGDVASGVFVGEWEEPAFILSDKVEITKEQESAVARCGANLLDVLELPLKSEEGLTREEVGETEVKGGVGGGEVEGRDATRLKNGESNSGEARGKGTTKGNNHSPSGSGEKGAEKGETRK